MSEPKKMGPEQVETNAERAVVVPPALGELATDLRRLIEATRARVAQTVNAELAMLNWQIGIRIHRGILAEARAGYGEEIVSTLSRQLTAEYAPSFSRQNLFHMIRFVEAWPDKTEVTGFAQHLGWSHFKEILYLEDQLARQFYVDMCRRERWSVRTLRERVRACCSNTPRFRGSQRRRFGRIWNSSTRGTGSRQDLCSAIPTCLIFSG